KIRIRFHGQNGSRRPLFRPRRRRPRHERRPAHLPAFRLRDRRPRQPRPARRLTPRRLHRQPPAAIISGTGTLACAARSVRHIFRSLKKHRQECLCHVALDAAHSFSNSISPQSRSYRPPAPASPPTLPPPSSTTPPQPSAATPAHT